VNKKGALYLFITLFFLNLSGVISQTIQEGKQPLIAVLKILESRYNISFSYADEAVKEKETIIPNADNSLSDALSILKENTHLEFKILDNRFVAIKTRPKIKSRKVEQLAEIVLTNYLKNFS